MFKKVFSIILSVLICLSMFTVSVGAEDKSADTLQFNKDGTFKIMQVADIQDDHHLIPATLDFFRLAIESEKPDLVVLLGDNISGVPSDFKDIEKARKNTAKAIDCFMSFFEEMNVPVAVVFGNHDAENDVTKEEQMQMYMSYDCCIAVDEGEEISGCGTYNIPVLSSDGKKIAYNFWFFDSCLYDEEKGISDNIQQNQIDWYIKKSNELKDANGGKPVDSMAFQHIPPKEIEKAEFISGEVNENPSPSSGEALQISAMLSQGDVKAVFFGHDHVNTYTALYEGIYLINCPTSGFGSYGDMNRGLRFVTIDENNTSEFETKLINYFNDYCNDDFSRCRYYVNSSIDVLWNILKFLIIAPFNGVSIFTAIYEVFCMVS
ncbi:MAG: metallophosphoesterase family protein [Clostridia bacterium]|nr:metallophosphoesterase family protein [Clostridia bacterium]